jgi:glycosyltransferase involved in cell wall biosynthesis
VDAVRPLRFCHLSIFYPPYSFGGDAMYLYRLVNALARRGHEVEVVHCADSYHVLETRTPTASFPNHPNVTVHTLRSRWGALGPLWAQQTGGTWPRAKAIRAVLNRKRFDVIHYHNVSLFGPKVLTIEPGYREYIKVFTAHEHWLICPMHVLWKNNERLCEKPDCMRCTLKFRRPPQWWRYTRLLERCTAAVDAFISPSRFTAGMHGERGFDRELAVVPYFVPAADQSGEPSESPHPRPYFLFVGRLEKIKGVQEILPVFRGYSQADLLIAGAGTYELELRAQAQGMSNVVFLGALSQERLRTLYRHAIAVLVPSICYEVFGIICIEAFMQNTPVIVHDLGGLREVVEESGGGFSYRTPAELVDAMERLRSDPGLRREKGELGHRTWQQRWSEPAHVERYFRVLEETARRKFGQVPWQSAKGDAGPNVNCPAASLGYLGR